MNAALLALALASPSAAAGPSPAALVYISNVGPARVETLKANADWWIELGDTLLVADSAARLNLLAQSSRVLRRFDLLDPAQLALQSRGCGQDDSALHRALEPIAMAGRFALVQAPKPFVSYPTAQSGDYFRAQVNVSYARELANVAPSENVQRAPDPLVSAVVERVSASRWFAALGTLASFNRSSYGLEIDQARDWLAQRFSALGLQVEQQTFTFSGSGGVQVSVENVIGMQLGREFPNEWIVVGGHYDSRNINNTPTGTALTPGAEDNASGCAGVLEMARVLYRTPPKRSVFFVCYAGEEQGLHGGHAHAQRWQSQGVLAQLRVALIMDMIGFSADSDLDVLLETNATHAATLHPRWSNYASVYAPELRVVLSNSASGSDHVPYLQRGRPSILTIENDWNVYSHYHKSTDLPANVSNASAMGGAILKMNAAALAVEADTSESIWLDRFEAD